MKGKIASWVRYAVNQYRVMHFIRKNTHKQITQKSVSN